MNNSRMNEIEALAASTPTLFSRRDKVLEMRLRGFILRKPEFFQKDLTVTLARCCTGRKLQEVSSHLKSIDNTMELECFIGFFY